MKIGRHSISISGPRNRASPVYERPFECRHRWVCHTVGDTCSEGLREYGDEGRTSIEEEREE
jgi:hypothetical protein